jgi:UDP-N-acetylmuramoyl-tripeptide--D-alanyl-D-alanine ligase
MGELGTDERALHYGVGAAVGQAGIDTLFCAGTLAEEYAKAAAQVNMGCEVLYFPEREAMTEALCAYVQDGDTILVKASHFMEFPKVVEALKALAK